MIMLRASMHGLFKELNSMVLHSSFSAPTSMLGGSSSLITGPWAEQSAVADEASIVQFMQGVSPQDLAGRGFTYRHDWGDRNGSWKLFLNWSAINARSRVFVAISEGAAGGPDAGKFIGAAKYTLFNVAPTNGGVDIWLHIDWSSPIRLYADYLVVNV